MLTISAKWNTASSLEHKNEIERDVSCKNKY